MIKNYITPNFVFADMVPDHATGSRVWDTEGKEYIDLSGGVAVNALGHCHPALIEALNTQAHKMWHISNYYTSEVSQNLAKTLIENSFAQKAFFVNSGAEANEAAFKLARKYACDRFGKEKNEIISCVNSFHGRTLFTVSVGGQPKYQAGFAPLPAGIHHSPFNDSHALENAVNENTCAVVLELVQGEGGVLPATEEFVQTARRLCNEHKALLIIDEVQTGLGRTGKLFAYEHYQIEPDIISIAKALGGGFPIGAMLCTDEVAAAFTPGSHGTTFGGNPLACAVALAAFNIINDPATQAHVQQQSQAFFDDLNALNDRLGGIFREIRGKGLLIGCVLSEQYEGRVAEITSLALQNGLMVLQAGANVLRLAPSLLITDEDRTEGLMRLEVALQQFLA